MPLSRMSIFLYPATYRTVESLATNGTIQLYRFPRGDDYDPFAPQAHFALHFFEAYSHDIVELFLRRFLRSGEFQNYTFEISRTFEPNPKFVTENITKQHLQMLRNFCAIFNIKPENMFSIHVLRDQQHYGTLELVHSAFIDLGGLYGFSRNPSQPTDILATQIVEDMRFLSKALETILEIICERSQCSALIGDKLVSWKSSSFVPSSPVRTKDWLAPNTAKFLAGVPKMQFQCSSYRLNPSEHPIKSSQERVFGPCYRNGASKWGLLTFLEETQDIAIVERVMSEYLNALVKSGTKTFDPTLLKFDPVERIKQSALQRERQTNLEKLMAVYLTSRGLEQQHPLTESIAIMYNAMLEGIMDAE